MTVKFSIPGEPQGKGRPRFARRGNFTRTYTPEQTAVYENLVRLCYQREAGGKHLTGAIKAEIEACFSIPKSTSKKKQALMQAGEIPCIKKPDCDNIAKIVLDACNKIAYDDDAQVSEVHIKKAYATTPVVHVTLTELEGAT